MTDLICTYMIYYALFQKKMFENDDIIIKKLPVDTFGVFTTIRRARKLNKWPDDIHGCIGYWNYDFNTLTQHELFNNLLRVSNDALNQDSRKNYFTDIKLEPESHMELDFMLNPIYQIDKHTGKIIELDELFDNKKFGIIIQSSNGMRATYLPDVFPNISWFDILQSIKDKAGIRQDSSNYEVFAYKIKQIKSTFISLVTEQLFGSYNIYKFAKLLFETMRPNLKYPIIYEVFNNRSRWNQTEQVRNISILMDLIKYARLFQDVTSKKNIDIIMKKITDILNNMHLYDSQALSFLGEAVSTSNREPYCEKLLCDLPNSEPEFERNEIIIGLKKAKCVLPWSEIKFTLEDSIFKINWIIQVYASYEKVISNELFYIFLQKIEEIVSKITEFETNYIAVAFEAFCFIYVNHPNNKIFLLLCELERRKNKQFLYEFLDKSCRTDITSHVMNGYCKLIK